MQQLAERSPSPLDILAILKVVKFFSLHRLFPLSTKLLASLPRFRRVRNLQTETAQTFVLVISIKYERWKGSNGRSMKLNTVGGDIKAILDLLNCTTPQSILFSHLSIFNDDMDKISDQHDNTDGRSWFFLIDYDLEYTDSSGTTKLLPRTGLPTWEIIRETLRKATMGGMSGLIHYSGHCHCKAPGTSELEDQIECILYKETEDLRRGPRAAFLITYDGKRIYGHEFYQWLLDTSASVGAPIITLVLDTCKAEAFIQNFGDLPIIYNAEYVEVVPTAALPTRPIGQLVVITAARADELAWTVNDSGILTFFLTECLRKHPMASATDVVKYLGDNCRRQPDATRLQHPRIWSRYPLTGPFRLTPKRDSPWYSWLEPWVTSTAQYARSFQAFRPVARSHMFV